ncbi:ABC transporter ATP-binding protein [Treponema endosymbiont of Eucomonympha sp.]|uniref:ABC transporter ATP-binding protein n=1 Tax=Treponema endosymbiont of Eucomonympha sp. TaxID=1580831 RepID=UPI0007513D98|nr:ABC transporter ATP-binding protein [Treponema endosymbiont of Eucomonympha sp.]
MQGAPAKNQPTRERNETLRNTSAGPLIKIRDMSLSYGRGKDADRGNVLSGVNMDVEAGEFHILLGPSGCGKSTLLNVLVGFLKNTGGEVTIYGKKIEKPGKDRGMVFQNADSAIFPWLTVRENVEFGLRMNGVRKKERRGIADKYISLVGLSGHEGKFPRELSGGMKQRTQIARLLTNDSDILVMDEPFGALDAYTRRVMQNELVRIWHETKNTVIFVTHDIQEAILLGQRIHIMSRAPNANIYKTYRADMSYPRKETAPEFQELFTRIQGHFDYGGGV